MNLVYISRSKTGVPHPFIAEQADALHRNHGVEVYHLIVARGGFRGYWQAALALRRYCKTHPVDLLHVHYGLWAPVVIIYNLLFFNRKKFLITFHGSDINVPKERRISLLCARRAAHSILVSEKMTPFFRENFTVLPCGIDVNVPGGLRERTRQQQGWDAGTFVILFSSSFERAEKDPDFARRVVEMARPLIGKKIVFLELKGYSRQQVTEIMQAADALVMCSFMEGSPQVLKEAVLNHLPVVSNDIGDIRSILDPVPNCFVVPKTEGEFVKSLKAISDNGLRITDNSHVVKNFDNDRIAEKLFSLYKAILKN